MSCDLTCRQFVDFLDAYIDGELADEPRATFEVHIEACPPCRDYLKSYADTIRLARGACREPDDPPMGLGVVAGTIIGLLVGARTLVAPDSPTAAAPLEFPSSGDHDSLAATSLGSPPFQINYTLRF